MVVRRYDTISCSLAMIMSGTKRKKAFRLL
jgi:hypothetical protein